MKNSLLYFRRKSRKRILATLAVWCLLSASLPFPALALPKGGRVGGGTVSWETVGNTMTVNQQSNRAIINWNSFSIGSHETVKFDQPGVGAAVLNRVTGAYSSEIFGSLLANGNVYLINPNGILFGAGSRINVGGLVASTFAMSDADFNAGRLEFSRLANSGKVINQGAITASSFAYLVGAGVENSGTITAPAVALAAGRDKIVIDRTSSGGEIRLSVDENMPAIDFGSFDNPALMANVENTGVVDASGESGGQVIMQGANVVQAGTVSADGTAGDGGRIDLLGERLVALGGESSTTANAGLNGDGGRIEIIAENFAGIYEGAHIAARGGSEGGDGGFVETSGHQNFVIDAVPDVGADNGKGGEWLIDPYNITIVNSGGFGWSGGGTETLYATFDNASIPVSAILEGLRNGDITIRTDAPGTPNEGTYGDITVAFSFEFTGPDYSGTTLTLDAANDINLDASIRAGDDNTLGLTAGGDVVQDLGTVLQLGTVDFNVGGSVSLEGSGNEIGTLTGTVGNNLAVVNNADLNLDGLSVENGATTLNVTGNVTDSNDLGANIIRDLDVVATGDITLDAENDFGEVTANANNGAGAILLNDINDIVLRNIDGGTLVVTTDGDITQTGDTRVMIAGESTLVAGGEIDLFNAANDFGGTVDADATGIRLRDANTIELGVVNAGADGLTVQTDGGAITQTEDGSVTVEGETFLTAAIGGTPDDILLGNEDNNFTGPVHADGMNIVLADEDDIVLGLVLAEGTLDVTAVAGGITQTDDGVTARGETTLAAFTDITLDNELNDFIDGPVNADGVNIALTDANEILLGEVNAKGTLDVTALDGDITQNDAGVIAAGVATLTAEKGDVVLDEEGNDFKDTVNSYAENTTLRDGADGISIGVIKANTTDDTAAQKVIITAVNGGGITDAQNDTVGHGADGFAEQTGDARTVNIIATEVLLAADGDIGTAGNALDISAGTLAAESKDGSVWLYETDDLVIGTVNGSAGISAAGNAKVETIDGALTVNEAVSATSGDILLAANGGGDLNLNATVTAEGGNITLLAANDIVQNAGVAAGATVDAQAGNSILMTAEGVTVADGNIRYTAAQDVVLNEVEGANIRIEATAGDITDLGDTPAIIADAAQLVAGGSVGGKPDTSVGSDDNPFALNTDVRMLAATAGTDGSIYIQNAGGALEIGEIAAIEVNRVALDSTTEAFDNGALSGAIAGKNLKVVNDTGDFTVSETVEATAGDMLLWAKDGALAVDAALTAGDLLTLQGNGVTFGADGSATAGGDAIVLGGSGNLSLAAVTGANILFETDGDIALDQITATDVVVVNAGGNITDANEDEEANITASQVRLRAGGGIGSGVGTGDAAATDTNVAAVDVDADNIEATAANGIYVQSVNDITVGGVGDTDGNITFQYARFDSGRTDIVDTDLTGISSDNGVVKMKSGGTLTVAETVDAKTDLLLMTTAGDINLNAGLIAGGNATVLATENLNQNAGITAGGDIYLSGASITADTDELISAGGNTLYSATGDFNVGTINADGVVSITAGGDILDANNNQDPNITATAIRLEAGGSVGTASEALDIESGAVEVSAGGEAHLHSQGTIHIGDVGEAQADYARFASGTSTETHADLSGFTTGGNASLTSDNGDITQSMGSDHVYVGGDTALSAGGNIELENPLNDFVGKVDSTARNTAIRDRNDLFVGHIRSSGHTRLTAGSSIIGVGGAPNVTSGSAEFYAGRDIGYPLYLDVGLIHEARAGGNIHMVEISGNMSILGQVYAGGDVRLDVLGGGIVDADRDGHVPPKYVHQGNADIYAGGTMYLTANFVGTLYEPLELISRGALVLDSHLWNMPDQSNYPWVVINGSVGRGARDIYTGKYGASIPGLVIYNGQVAAGPWWSVRQFQLAQRTPFDRYQPTLLDSGITRLPYFLQPDMSLLSNSVVRDDLRKPEEKRVTGAEDVVPEDEPRTDAVGIPVTMID